MKKLWVLLVMTAVLGVIGCQTYDEGAPGTDYDTTYGTGTNDYNFERPNPTANPWPGAPTDPY